MNGFDGKNLVVFGDSIMYGSGNNGFGVGEYLKKDLGFKLYKYCIGGARTGWHEGKSWIVEQVCTAVNDKIPADYIVFNGFTNDCNMTDGVNCDVPLGDMSDSAPQDIFEISKQNTTFSGCIFRRLSFCLCARTEWADGAKPFRLNTVKEPFKSAKNTALPLPICMLKAGLIPFFATTATNIPATATAGAEATAPTPTRSVTKNFICR